MILIVSDKFDLHADLIERKLVEQGHETFRLDVDFESLLTSIISFAGGEFAIRVKDRLVRSIEIDTVLLRRTFVELSYEMKDELTTAHKIWRGEWNKSLQGMYYFLSGIPTINPPKAAFAAENKFLQMDKANRLGFKVPDFLVSNDKEALSAFRRKKSEVVLKMMYQDLYREKDGSIKGIYVNKINEFAEFKESGENPIFVQEYIEKAYEVRYTVIGDRHFVCRIDSQSSPVSAVDWRRYDLPNTPYASLTPPIEVRDRVNALLQELGLVFGALDFIVNPAGDWYFLEVNPMGQWLWIEDLAGLPISDAIVAWLAKEQA